MSIISVDSLLTSTSLLVTAITITNPTRRKIILFYIKANTYILIFWISCLLYLNFYHVIDHLGLAIHSGLLSKLGVTALDGMVILSIGMMVHAYYFWNNQRYLQSCNFLLRINNINNLLGNLVGAKNCDFDLVYKDIFIKFLYKLESELGDRNLQTSFFQVKGIVPLLAQIPLDKILKNEYGFLSPEKILIENNDGNLEELNESLGKFFLQIPD